MKYAWIDQNAKHFELHELCRVLEVSISGYRSWKRGGSPERKRLTDAQMLALIQAIHAELKGAYGSPRMVRELRARHECLQDAGGAAHARSRHSCASQAALPGHHG